MALEKKSRSEHKLTLARELVDDIELSRLLPENLILKAARLARLVGDEEKTKWLNFELVGFGAEDPVSLKWMGMTGRWTDEAHLVGYWIPFAQIESQIAMNKLQIQQVQVPNIHFAPSSANPSELVTGWAGINVTTATAPVSNVLKHLNELNSTVSQLTGIRSKMLAFLHAFVTRSYYELEFGNQQESLFEKQRVAIDARLASSCGGVLEKVPAVYDRLTEGDPEAISQALNTCRRIVDAFADSIYQPSSEGLDIGGTTLQVTAAHHQNRIYAFVFTNCTSTSRRKRIRHILQDLYDRLSTGVHSDVTAEEARFLFLQTYLVIGEVLSLRIPASAPEVQQA